jgi:16S rRNA (guanine527-N7)-methyltransferase
MKLPLHLLSLTQEQTNKLEAFADFLLAYNKHTNLTSITDPTEFVIKHLEDTLALVKQCDWQQKKVLDVGSGGGFPGIVLLIMHPTIQLTMMDSTLKKVEFLRKALAHLELKAEVVNARAEDWITNNREAFDIVTARAVAPLQVLVEWCVPYVKIGGMFVAMKSRVDEELKSANNCISKTGGMLAETIPYSLSMNMGERTLVIIKKTTATPVEYPRPNRIIQREAMK